MNAILRRIINQQVEIKLSGDELDDELRFTSRFFNRLGIYDSLPFQLQYITDSLNLKDVGRHVMARIGEYSTESNY
jgi:hypothetical protein